MALDNTDYGMLQQGISELIRATDGIAAAIRETKTASPRSVYRDYLGSWDDWGARIEAIGLPTCAHMAIAHLYGQHDKAPHAYCPMCDEADGCTEGDRQLEAAMEDQAGLR